ncbi:SEL1-like repeat protein [Pseudotamlana carrageenivorans]|uniref:Uncharacterized protein n=1 Tax=Pseudotamlana carrageenivorans TaxID=2069432 RepID=A0A2I7SFL7_9FLAO|nr:SEL1-like repeat protein [Tamlana carrageenivorans]AUS04709.1 hypothetical protein C1A40_04115 [Tamlana carrageenivorans]
MANYWLGVCYLNGDGVLKDLEKANELLGRGYQVKNKESTISKQIMDVKPGFGVIEEEEIFEEIKTFSINTNGTVNYFVFLLLISS